MFLSKWPFHIKTRIIEQIFSNAIQVPFYSHLDFQWEIDKYSYVLSFCCIPQMKWHPIVPNWHIEHVSVLFLWMMNFYMIARPFGWINERILSLYLLNVKTCFKVYIMTHGLKKYNNEILKANFKGSLYTIDISTFPLHILTSGDTCFTCDWKTSGLKVMLNSENE